ncbi:uncharacterized protein TM35_000023920 [Trypanosoma theileri]|uniref:LRRK2 ARM repeat domain-containing protein n=1 Tax=Trypanosoma theileri TaxID=67003 RepID=A0A1X0P7Z1_9TRYP|nr:uncharacterized protein TM35_000023920 [Trypanosoma theileri]ORC93066.1 hypothetical protein TM35_000023920 [Trypanosoma theileri]
MKASLTSSNRANIPAVCQIKGCGTATLISPGILLTSIHVVKSAEVAADLTAVFFEGSNKKTVEVKLLPQNLFFAATYPDYMDYCIVACEQYGIFNVTPVKLPLIKSEWAPVREGDTILVVQHPIVDRSGGKVTEGNDGGESEETSSLVEVKRFEEVMRCRDDVFYLKASGNVLTAGCPSFNDCGQLIGMQSQLRQETGGVISRVLSIVSIVKHLFANKQLGRIRQELSFEDVWSTWYVDNNVPRVILILANFTSRPITRATAEKLCELTCQPNLLESVLSSGGVHCILLTLKTFKEDEDMVCKCIRALWNLTFVEGASRQLLSEENMVEIILDAIEQFSENEEIAEYATVLLHNISTDTEATECFAGPLGHRALILVHAAMQRFKHTNVLQKFGLSFFTTLICANPQNAETLVQLHMIEHVAYLAEHKQDQVFLMEALMHFVGELAQHKNAIELCLVDGGLVASGGSHIIAILTGLVIDIMLKYQEMDTILLQGNRALWGIGNDLACRVVILQHPNSYEALKLSLPALISKARVM